jgi:hypothetical protein
VPNAIMFTLKYVPEVMQGKLLNPKNVSAQERKKN